MAGEGEDAGVWAVEAAEARQNPAPRLGGLAVTLKERYVRARAAESLCEVLSPTLYASADMTEATAGDGNPWPGVRSWHVDCALDGWTGGPVSFGSDVASFHIFILRDRVLTPVSV
jgi:hypothetical protein